MEPFLLLIEGWWWVAPAAAGVGTASYMGLTTNRRRARRLELDAARHEESHAYKSLAAAKAQVRAAQAALLAARSRSGSPAAAAQARRVLGVAKDDERSAALALRASRARIKAVLAQYRMATRHDPLPIERLSAAHDAINAEWLAYETDVDKALAFPRMTDPRHPATAAFLRAQREAQSMRPSPGARVTPQEFLAYRGSVEALHAAFAEAERQAGARPAERGPGGVSGMLEAASGLIDAALPVWEGLRASLLTPRSSGPKPPGAQPR